ncbi:MAG: uracil-DNA glycosylase [Notoacmeibacter sp.]|nr:uracil-DNA glycosylase [Notoacmeibacter sp.]
MDDLASLLHFYRDAGADWVLEDAPVDRFAESAAKLVKAPGAAPGAAEMPAPPRVVTAARAASPAPAPSFAPSSDGDIAVPDEGQVMRARDLARGAETLDALRKLYMEFDGCNLKFAAKSFVFADGNPDADLMIIGEAPGREEDLQGLPFVGRSGQLLDRMLAAIGRDRSSAYITNVIAWRPPGNRTPTPHETEICRPFLERHIELMAPKAILTLGGPAAKAVTHAAQGIMRLRGNWITHRTPGGMEIAVMPSLHPAYLLRNPAHKKLAWHDLLAVKMRLAGRDQN